MDRTDESEHNVKRDIINCNARCCVFSIYFTQQDKWTNSITNFPWKLDLPPSPLPSLNLDIASPPFFGVILYTLFLSPSRFRTLPPDNYCIVFPKLLFKLRGKCCRHILPKTGADCVITFGAKLFYRARSLVGIEMNGWPPVWKFLRGTLDQTQS